MFAMNPGYTGGYTFIAPDGKKFTKIEITATTYEGWYTYAFFSQLESGWPSGEEAAADFNSTLKFTWTGSAASVNLATTLESFGPSLVSSIDFYFEAPSGPTVIDSGDCGTTGHESEVTWSLTDDGVMTISGTGAMADYENTSSQPWSSKRSSITSIVVGEGVTHIGNNAFRTCTKATSISLPSTLTSIGERAFQGCNNADLTSITIPDNVETIGNYAFTSCSKLTSVNIPNKVTTIGNNAFQTCSSLGTVTIGSGVTTIGNIAFGHCSELTSVNIPSSVTTIGNQAFQVCTKLATVILNSNPAMGTYVFYNITPAPTVTMNLTANAAGDAKWATFYNKNYSFEADANTQVFKARLSDTSITLYEVTDKIVDAGTAVVLKTTGGGNPVMTLTTSASSNADSNSLLGVSDAAGLTAAAPSTTFVLNNGTGGVGFYRLKSGKTLGVGKAYLTYSGASAPEFFGFGETTGVNEVRGQMEDVRGEYYDLQGRRVAQPTKGLYIVNGKKVVIK